MNGYNKAQEIYDDQTPDESDCDEYCECVDCLINNFNDEEEWNKLNLKSTKSSIVRSSH